MSTPRHRTAPGSSYSTTTKCWQGRHIFQIPEVADIPIRAIFHYRDRHAHLLHEFVVMPDHLHLLVTPAVDASLENFIKGGSSQAIHKQRPQRMEIWQEGFYDWTVHGGDDWGTKVAYIRADPVVAKLVTKPEDWLHSSASGQYALDPVPERFLHVPSGAQALAFYAGTLGLKPRPPEGRQP